MILKYNFFSLVCIFFISIGVLNGAHRIGLFNDIDYNIKYLDFIKLINKDQSSKKLIYADIEKQSQEDCKKLKHILEGYKGIICMNLLKKYIDQNQIKKIFCNEQKSSDYYISIFKEINSKRIKPNLDRLTNIFDTEIKTINNRKKESGEDRYPFMRLLGEFIHSLELDDEIVLPIEIIDIFKKYLLTHDTQDNHLIKQYYLVLIKHNMMRELTELIGANIQSEDIKNNFDIVLRNHCDKYSIDSDEKIGIVFLECIIDQMELNNISSESIFLTSQIEEYIKFLTNNFNIKEIKDLEYYFYICRGKMIGDECEFLIKNKNKLPHIFIHKLKQQLILIRDKIAKLMEGKAEEAFNEDITFYKIQRQKYLKFVEYNIMHERKIYINNDNPKQFFEEIRNSIDMFFEDQTKKKDWLFIVLNIIIEQIKLKNINSDMFLENHLEEYIKECTVQVFNEENDLLVEMEIVNPLKEDCHDCRIYIINSNCQYLKSINKRIPNIFIDKIKEYLMYYQDKYKNALYDIKEFESIKDYLDICKKDFNPEDKSFIENEDEFNDGKCVVKNDMIDNVIIYKKNDRFVKNYNQLWNNYLIIIKDIMMIIRLDLKIRNLLESLFSQQTQDTFSLYFDVTNKNDFDSNTQKIKFDIYVLKFIQFNDIVNIKNLFENRAFYLYIRQFIDNTEANSNDDFEENTKKDISELRVFFNTMIQNYEKIKKNNQYKNIAIFLLALVGVVVFFVLKTDTINQNISSIKIIKTD